MGSSGCPPFQFSAKYYHYQVSENGDGCFRQPSFFQGKSVLNQGVGYSVILGFGVFFAVFTSFLVTLHCLFHFFSPFFLKFFLLFIDQCSTVIVYMNLLLLGSGMVRETICWVSSYIRMVQYCRQECQNRTNC